MTLPVVFRVGRCIRTGLCAAALFVAGQASAEDRSSIAIGTDVTRGDYGSDVQTTIVSVPLNLQLRRGQWQLDATLPWLRVSGNRDVLPGLGPLPVLGALPGEDPQAERTTTSGMGDLEVAAKYTLDMGGAIGIDVGAAAKLATADEDRGLGTGANDYSVGVDVYREVGGTLLFAGADNAWLGESDRITADTQQRATIGLSRRAGPGHLGLVYAQRSALVEHVDERRDASVFYNASTASGRRFKVHASRGLSDGSPDWGLGISVGTEF